VDRLGEYARSTGVVLLTATRDPALSHAAVLAELLLEEPGGRSAGTGPAART
jgi:uncharacterized protein YeaO (DUF488 family)